MGQQPIVLSDCRIKMTANSLEKYPQGLRLVSACVSVNGKPCDMNFITNNFDWSACFCHKTSMNHFMGYLWIYAKNMAVFAIWNLTNRCFRVILCNILHKVAG